ncbi:PAS domain S-box protein [Aerosakkonema funiforme]|uniref:PAS domain S-box protein n=1 Tax=Aerosakkonema funiforme TaxID=1246630 RepID=UPI0035B76EA4
MYKRLKRTRKSVYNFKIKETELLRQRNAELEQQVQHSAAQLQESLAAGLRQAKQAALLNQIIQAMRGTLVLDELLQIAVNELHSALNVSRCLIFRTDVDNDLGIRYVSESTSAGNSLIGCGCDFYHYYRSHLANGEPLVLPRIKASEPPEILSSVEHCNICALIIAPLIYQQRFMGAISLKECRGEREWTPEEIEFVKAIADHCAIAIHQAELYQQAQTELQERQKAEAALRESNELFQQLAENIQQGFFVKDAIQNKILYVSHALQDIWGFSAEIIYNNPHAFLDAVHPEDRECVTAAFESHICGLPYCCEYRIIRQNGEIGWLEIQTFPLKNSAGEVYRITGIVEDITARKTAETNLRQQAERERLIRLVTERIRQSLNLDDILTTAVAEVRHFLQTDRVIIFQLEEDASGLVVQESVDPNWQPILGHNIFDSCFHLYIDQYRQGRVRAIADIDDGSIQWCHAHFLRQFDVRANLVVPILQNNYLWGLLIAHHCAHPRQWSPAEIELLKQVADQVAIAIQQAQLYQQVQEKLTARIQAEIALRESEKLFRLMADSAPVLIWLADAQGECTFFNQTWQKFTGRSLERELQGNWTENILPEDLDRYLNIRTAAIQARKSFSLQYRLRRADGEYRWILDKGVPRLTPEGELLGYIGSCVDITQQKQAETRLQKLNEELEIKVQYRTHELQQIVEKLADEILHHCRTEIELQDSQAKLQAILDNSPAVIYVNDLQNRYILVNRQYEKLFNHNNEKIIGKTIYDYWPLEIAERFVATNQQIIKEKTAQKFEEVVPQTDGLHTYISIKFPLKYSNDVTYAVCGISMDITERKRAEEALKQSEARFQKMAANVPGMLCQYLLSPNGFQAFPYISPRCREIWETEPEVMQADAQKSLEIIHIDDRLSLFHSIKVSAQNLQPWHWEGRIITPSGRLKWIQGIGRPEKQPNGDILWDSLFIDISDRKQAEAALRNSELRLGIALEAALMGTWDWNIQTNQVMWSERTEAIFGLAPGSFPGTQEAFINCIHPEDRPALAETIQLAIRDRKPLNSETRIIRPDDTLRWIACIGNIIRDRADLPERMTGVVMDITERKLAEQQLRTSLKEKEILLKEIHHRVKNNLQIISSLLKLQSTYIKDESVLALFTESFYRVRSMALIHEKLYQAEDLARVDAADYISNLVENLFRSYKVSLNSIDLKIEIDSIKLDVDTAIPCGLIINELVSNSLKYGFSGRNKGQLCMTFLHRDNNTLYLRVSDDGVGLPPDFDIEQIQSLGLQLVINLTEQLGGELEIDSHNGASFAITFVAPPYLVRENTTEIS